MTIAAEPRTLMCELLRVLRESPLPIPTPDLIAIVAVGKSNPRSRVWTQLSLLLQHGLVQREVRTVRRTYRNRRGGESEAAFRVAFWRLATNEEPRA